jgi:hypothetical protein
MRCRRRGQSQVSEESLLRPGVYVHADSDAWVGFRLTMLALYDASIYEINVSKSYGTLALMTNMKMKKWRARWDF